MALINITRWASPMVFLLAGVAGVVFAFVTVNLFSEAMASLEFLREYGWEAVRFGALWQVAELLIYGCLALGCWLVFKICEHELEHRYIGWARGHRRERLDQDQIE